jgi:hypothetical protein
MQVDLRVVQSLIRTVGKMNCTLCERPIHNYEAAYNHLEIDETHAADICRDCIDKFLKWQQGIYARLFPTSAVKNRFGKK